MDDLDLNLDAIFFSCPLLLILSSQYLNFSVVNLRPRSGTRACAARSAGSSHASGLICVCLTPYLVQKVVSRGFGTYEFA